MELNLKEKYGSTKGINSLYWGPKSWDVLFTSVMGAYPFEINKKSKEHQMIKKSFKNTLLALEYTMPCIYCRKSFKIFIKELPIKKYLDSRLSLMYWLYQIKEKVNKKLREQEQICFQRELKETKHKITKKEYNELHQTIFYTKPSPSFEEVLDKYELLRSSCDKVALTCR